MENGNPKSIPLAREHPEFITITCLNWIPVVLEDRFKNIILESLSFLVKADRIQVYAFVIMSNHLHLIWQMLGEHKRKDVQRDFLKFTSQQILKHLRNEESILQNDLLVQAKDRKFQVWERNSLSIPLWAENVFMQKLDYIHTNPVKAGMCKYPEEYKYSSAGFYLRNEKHWGFLTHYDG
jgi:REP element-mobilizing transposase RayT